MKTTAEIVKELEEAKKQLATLEAQNYALSATVQDLRTSIEAQKKTLRLTELKNAEGTAQALEKQLNDLKDWLDANYKFMNVTDGEVRIATPCKRVWYHATDNVNLYPFSQLAGKVA
jgi:septation ring formation regulator EzrA